MDGDAPGVLQVYAVSVEAVPGGRDGHVVDLHGFTVIELEVALRAVLNCYAGDCHVVTPIEPQSLP